MDDWVKLATIIGTIVVTIVGGFGGNKLLNKTAGSDISPVEKQLNMRLEEKDRQIARLEARVDELEDDLAREREARGDDARRYQTQLDDLRDRFDRFRLDGGASGKA